jgi:hypothetical protein
VDGGFNTERLGGMAQAVGIFARDPFRPALDGVRVVDLSADRLAAERRRE